MTSTAAWILFLFTLASSPPLTPSEQRFFDNGRTDLRRGPGMKKGRR